MQDIDTHPERHIVPGDTRKPLAGHLRYATGVETPNPVEPMGPTYLAGGRPGERLWPCTIERTDTHTVVGFCWAFPTLAFDPATWERAPDLEAQARDSSASPSRTAIPDESEIEWGPWSELPS